MRGARPTALGRAERRENRAKEGEQPPQGAEPVRHRGVVFGALSRPTRPALAGRAARRLSELDALSDIRRPDGVLPPDARSFLRVLVDALAELPGRLTFGEIADRLPETLPADVIERAMSAPRRAGRLLSNAEAGRLIGFRKAELDELMRRGLVPNTIETADETRAEREERRAERRRVMGAERSRRHRAKNVTADLSPALGGGTKGVTLQVENNSLGRYGGNVPPLQPGKGPERVLAAIAAGCATKRVIAKRAGLSAETVKTTLKRLIKSGAVERVAPGEYALPSARRAAQAAPAPTAPVPQPAVRSPVGKAARPGLVVCKVQVQQAPRPQMERAVETVLRFAAMLK